ncbi:VOC family protein [Kribbella sp. NPDC059898]|uniref:VOC family protein n=1 Tax=Kribbella sp. NPDC059898 TaxID=3346995 RepID=UPI00364E1247
MTYSNGELVVVVDVADLDRAAAFWTAALGYARAGESSTYQTLLPAGGPGIEILLQQVPDRKQAKNRVHLDLRTPDLDAEVARLLVLGARQLTADPLHEDGWTWHVLADPDGNEFCVLQPPD